jgi:FlaA1/EpsC-like NDP-sugar epimerase
MYTLFLIGRTSTLFDTDISLNDHFLRDCIEGSCCLVIGGAGSIGQAVTFEIFKRSPAVLSAH